MEFYRKILVLLCTLLITASTHAQSIKGSIVDGVTNAAVPYASIILSSDKTRGNLSNHEGRFTFRLAHLPDTLVISHIGFQKKKIVIHGGNVYEDLRITLDAHEQQLREIVIFSEDTLLKLLTRAFQSIEKNYPTRGTLIKGFYRETNQLLPENKFLYFSESTMECYKPGYGNKHFGPVRIVEGAKAELPSRGEYNDTHFYAGLYVPQRFDFVKNRTEFINPAHFKKYIYSVEGKKSYEDREVYMINFKPQYNGSFEGKFLLDAKTLAYIEAEYHLTPYGLIDENIGFSQFKFSDRKFLVRYKADSSHWNIYLVFQDGIGSKKSSSSKVRYTNEFIATEYETTNVNPISEGEAIPFSGVYTRYENKFSNTFWSKPEVIARTENLEQNIDLLFRTNELKVNSPATFSTSLRNDSLKANAPKHTRLLKLITRLTSSFSAGFAPVSTAAGLYNVSYKNAFNLENQLVSGSMIPTIGSTVQYHLTTRTAIVIKQHANLDKKYKFSFVSVGAEWSKRLLGWKNPLTFHPGVSFYYSASGVPIGKANLSTALEFGNTTLDSKTINVSIGETRFGIAPSAALVLKTGGKFSIFTEIQTSAYSWAADKIFLREENGFLLTRRTVKLKPESAGLALQQNGVTTRDSGTGLQNFKFFTNVGLRIGLR